MTDRLPIKVLILEDRDQDARLMIAELKSSAFDPVWRRVETETDYLEALAEGPDLILADYNLPQFDATRALALLTERQLDIPLIIVTGSISEEKAAEAMERGAADYLLKDRLVRLGPAAMRALEERRLRQAMQQADDQLHLQVRMQALVADVSSALTSSDSLRGILQSCTDALVNRLEVAAARIWTVNQPETLLELQVSSGDAAGSGGRHESVGFGTSKVGLVALQRAPYLTNDLAHDLHVSDPDWVRRERLVSFAGYPLLVEERLVGVVAVFSRQLLAESALEAMAAVASQIALGIERKRFDESLRITERRLQQLISTTPAVIFALRREGGGWVPAWVSQSVERLTGYDEYEAMSPDWWRNHVHPDELGRVELFPRSLEATQTSAAEYRFRCRDGEYRWLLDQRRLIVDADGQPVEVVGSWLDITERKQLEEQFRQSQKMEAIGRLAGGVAHDFNNLLTVIIGYSDLLLENLPAGDSRREFLQQVSRAGTQGAALTRQLLAFSRRQLLVPLTVDFNNLLQELEKMLGRLIGEDIDLKFLPGPELWPVKVDPGQMEQVMMNLVVNARDAMPQGGRLTIETANCRLDEEYCRTHPHARGGDHVRIAVSDNGCGMTAATRARIFEPFFTTKTVDKGTGLGLATVHGIITQSGGHLEVYSEPGFGSTFKIYIPRDASGVSAASLKTPTSTAPHGSETVLLVEDSPGVRSFARLALERCGYKLLEADGPLPALGLMQECAEPVHLLVTDVVMPNMSGRQLAETLQPDWPEMKVLYISGYTDDAVVRHGILQAGTPFLQKPFSPDDLARKVRSVLDGE